MATPADIQRMVGDLGRLGTVVSVDHATATCRVQLGEIVSGDLPWLEVAAGTTRSWCPPSVGEQVAVFSPEADLACGFVLGRLYTDAHAAPWNDAAVRGMVFSDGAYLSYDARKGELVAVLPAGAKALIEAPAGLTVRGPVRIEGTLETSDDVTVGGKIDATGDVVAGRISLQTHVHDKVQTGGAVSGRPVA